MLISLVAGVRLDDQQVNIAVAGHLARSRRAEENDFIRLGDEENPATWTYDVLDTITATRRPAPSIRSPRRTSGSGRASVG